MYESIHQKIMLYLAIAMILICLDPDSPAVQFHGAACGLGVLCSNERGPVDRLRLFGGHLDMVIRKASM
jgi:hypothetical protein